MNLTQERVTAADLLKLPRGVLRHELVKGELVQMPLSNHQHGSVTATFSTLLGLFVRREGLGQVCGSGVGFQLSQNPDTVLSPDISFVCQERLEELDNKGYFPGAPDLAVEIISPSDIYEQVEIKVGQWLAAGTKAVIIVNPRQRSVKIHRSAEDVTILTEKDTLTLPELFADWQLKVTDIFD